MLGPGRGLGGQHSGDGVRLRTVCALQVTPHRRLLRVRHEPREPRHGTTHVRIPRLLNTMHRLEDPGAGGALGGVDDDGPAVKRRRRSLSVPKAPTLHSDVAPGNPLSTPDPFAAPALPGPQKHGASFRRFVGAEPTAPTQRSPATAPPTTGLSPQPVQEPVVEAWGGAGPLLPDAVDPDKPKVTRSLRVMPPAFNRYTVKVPERLELHWDVPSSGIARTGLCLCAVPIDGAHTTTWGCILGSIFWRGCG